MRSLSIRSKIISLLIIVLVVVLAINFIVFYFIGERVARETAREDLKEMVMLNLDEMRFKEGDTPGSDDESTPHYIIKYDDGYLEIDDFIDLMSGVACGLYTSDGSLIYGLNYLPRETKEIDFMDDTVRQVESSEEIFYIYDRKVSIEGRDDIWVRGMIDRGHDQAQVYRMYVNYIMILPLMLIFATLIVYIVTRRALLPLNSIVEEVERINWGSDLKQRLETGSNDYEIRIIVDALNDMLNRLHESYEAGKRFTSNVSHDLRTPLAIISAQTELALEEELPDDAREAFENIRKQGIRAEEILNGLLTYARLEDMSETYEMSDIDVSAAVISTCRSFTIIDEKDISLEQDIQEGIHIIGNEALIHGLVENLLSNAYKYSYENGQVRIGLEEDEDEVRLTVGDDGIGMSEEEMEKIFDWMYRSEGSAEVEGSGIGLFIVKLISELHGADIKVRSMPGEGSEFTIVFPKVECEKEEKDGRKN